MAIREILRVAFLLMEEFQRDSFGISHGAETRVGTKEQNTLVTYSRMLYLKQMTLKQNNFISKPILLSAKLTMAGVSH
jgi:hypothetical protein